MTSGAIGLLGIGALLVLILLRIPIGIALISVSFAGIWAIIGLEPALGMLRVVPHNFATNWQLSSVPMFLFMGFLCFHAGLTKGLFEAARVWLSRLPGGLAVASVFGAAGFAAVTGSSVACAAAMGRIAVPEMMRQRYDAAFATGTVAAAGTIGALIPPSILFIIYGIIAQQPIGKLFLAGSVAGLITAASYVLTIVGWATIRKEVAPRIDTTFSMREKVTSLLGVLPVVLLALIVFGGLFSGAFTPTEAGAVGAGIALIIALLQGTLTWDSFRASVVEAFATSAALFVIAIGASLLARFVALSGAGNILSGFVLEISANRAVLLFGIAMIYVVLGMFLDPMGAMRLFRDLCGLASARSFDESP